MNNEDYFDVNAVSNSRLNLIDPDMGGSPARYLAGFDPDGERKKSKALEMGSAAHTMILEPHKFVPIDFEPPSEMMQNWAVAVAKMGPATNNNILKAKQIIGAYAKMKDEGKICSKFLNEGQEFYDFTVAAVDKIVLKQADFVALSSAATSIMAHPRSTEIMKGEKELEIYFDMMGQKCKSKLDIVEFMPGENRIRIPDLKTTSKNPRFAQGFIQRYRTYRQLAFYGIAAEHYALDKYGMSNPTIEYTVIMVGLNGQFETVICTIDPRWIAKGRMEIGLLMQRLKFADEHPDGWIFSKEEIENDYLNPIMMPDE